MEPGTSLPIQYRRRRSDRDILQELIPYRIREVLLVATYYDSYNIIKEEQFFERIYGDYVQLNLFYAPRITSASNWHEVQECMETRKFDLVIIMSGVDRMMPLDISANIKKHLPDVPILLLANNNSDLKFFNSITGKMKNIERVFVWNGDSTVFVAMIKYVEDRLNVEVDVEVGDVRIILLVEDSKRYYSRYLPLLYSIIRNQTQAIMMENATDPVYTMHKMRVRPKILLVSNFEEAVEIIDKYKENLLCLISDVEFPRDGQIDDKAGIDLVKYVQKQIILPVLLQSSDSSNAELARLLNADFVDKNSPTLSNSINEFIYKKLGFGSFRFTTSRGVEEAVANNLEEFEECLKYVSAESLVYHGKRHGIWKWLMARGEIILAKRLRKVKIEDFESTNQLRQFMLNVFEEVRFERMQGKVINYNPVFDGQQHFVMRIGEGSLGGKGRGMAFISNYIESINLNEILPDIRITIPCTTIIGADEYANFVEKNDLFNRIIDESDYELVKKMFLSSVFPSEIEEQLRLYIENNTTPLALRSSGLFEDSLLQPFAGVYSTYILANNNEDKEVRFQLLSDAVKLIYASMFSHTARSYYDAVNYKVEEEKMAVIIQHLVGQRVNDRFYPNISGVAQSYNYYPLGYMKPDDGFAVIAIGLGKYVVGGEKAWRFCPAYPKLDINSLADQVKDSQTYFYALSLDPCCVNLLSDGEDSAIVSLPIKEAEEDGTLKHCASVYNYEYDMMVHDFSQRGPRVVNFSNILKYDYIPLARSIDLLLKLFKQAMGSPVEIEFAVDLEDDTSSVPTLYLLQIKPLIRVERDIDISIDEVDMSKVWLKSMKGMGNGELDYIRDIIFVKTDLFDRTKTVEMAAEMDKINTEFEEKHIEYILIGPGRWGTRDRFTGIPVYWSQISMARIIVEMGLDDFPLDASLGSHFFHNVTSMNVGYFSVRRNSKDEWIDMDFLMKQEVIAETEYFRHVRLTSPCKVLMDGRQQVAVIVKPEE